MFLHVLRRVYGLASAVVRVLPPWGLGERPLTRYLDQKRIARHSRCHSVDSRVPSKYHLNFGG